MSTSEIFSRYPLEVQIFNLCEVSNNADLTFFYIDFRNTTDLATGDGKHKPTNFLTSLLRFHFERIRKSLLVTLSN